MALVAAIVAALTFAFVWEGSQAVGIEWRALENDYKIAELHAKLNPPEATDYEDTQMSSGPASTPVLDGDNYVLWLNISGFRGDYVENAEAPFLEDLLSEGYHTDSLMPVFPSLEYPNLVSQATGVPVGQHHISSNVMRDPESKETLERPTKLSLLKAEPIWTTAKRQGIRVLVHDWPMSQEQPSENAADIYLSEFDPSLSDEDRLNKLYDAWASDEGETKLRLIMGSLHDIDTAGRKFGCRTDTTYEAVAKLDGQLKAFFEKIENNWADLSNSGDKLYVIITTDHGMHDAEKLINFGDLMGDLTNNIQYTVDDAVAHVWFKPGDDGAVDPDFIEEFDGELSKRIYWRSFDAGSYPSAWNFGEGGDFVGDRLLVLKPGYAFSTEKGSEAVYGPAETGGPYSISGFAVQDQTRMKGQVFAFELGGGSGSDLGEIEATQFHATVAKLLEIEPAEGADSKALSIN